MDIRGPGMRTVLHAQHVADFPTPGHVSRIVSFNDGDFCPRKCCGCHMREKETNGGS